LPFLLRFWRFLLRDINVEIEERRGTMKTAKLLRETETVFIEREAFMLCGSAT
jgi:hypothetical protein